MFLSDWPGTANCVIGFVVRPSTAGLAAALVFAASAAFAQAPPARSVRVIVEVPPETISGRPHDLRPAELTLKSADFGQSLRIDLATLRVEPTGPAAAERDQGALPLRWYDDAVPYDFPECEQNVHSTDGRQLIFVERPRWGDFYNLEGDGRSGRLVWQHRKSGESPSRYRVSFDLVAAKEDALRVPPRGFVGDGSHRCLARGASSTGMIHSRVCLADWNSDGRVDLLVGGARGHVLVYENRGSAQAPSFGRARLVLTSDGRPLDVGWSAAPLAVDWNADGLVDLLCGGERNRVLYYRNQGSRENPRLALEGFVTVDGKPLELPTEPVPKSPPGVYTLDYYPVLEGADLNGDGLVDLLAGGYITGRIYYFENKGLSADGTPRLATRGPIEADGRPLNVGDWAASPCAFDFDADGDLDLISGNMAMTAGGGDSSDPEHFLRYYENTGSRTESRFSERTFPRKGSFPNSILATPRAADFNADGLPDLVVSAGENIYLYVNAGTRRAPRFAVDAPPLPATWGSVPLPVFGLQFLDYDGDGRIDLLSGLSVYCQKQPGEFMPEPLLAPGNSIDHPAPRGDGWTFTRLVDLDGDGRRDLLYGTHEGNIWLHRCNSGLPTRYDEAGEQLATRDGQPIRVGPQPGQNVDFDVLQGARTTFDAADFDADGLLDLVVGDTYGKVRQYRNLGPRVAPRFDAPVDIGDLGIRMVPYAADWNLDRRVDIVGASAGGKVVVWLNQGEGRLGLPRPIAMPAVPYSPSVAVVDWNGDGDLDLIVGTAYGYFCFFERSFLELGYARATLVEVEP